MIIRATQKKMMSNPVTSTEDGRKVSRSRVFSGQPSEVNGTRAEENQVSGRPRRGLSAPRYPSPRPVSLLFFASGDVDIALIVVPSGYLMAPP